MTFSEEFASVTPVNFFQVSADCLSLPGEGAESFPYLNKKTYKKYLLPDTSVLCSESSFAEIAMGWSIDGLEFYIDIDSLFSKSVYPEITSGDSVELFIDTHDVKTSGFNTRFCHHFFFLAEGVDGCFAGELTRFRTEDSHPLCETSDLKVRVLNQASCYSLNIFIPKNCLHGYEPEQFDRLGFTYRINRTQGFPQHFSVVTDDYNIEQQPSLWGTIKLKRRG